VLTARHVVKDARKIVVWSHTGKRARARVLVESTWDCAVLELAEALDCPAVDVEVETLSTKGERLELVGFGGPKDGLAASRGVLIGYRRPAGVIAGPGDWLEITGAARQGDSGGPIFNVAGRVVAVGWGSDGRVITGVQAGRLCIVLDVAAGRRLRETGYGDGGAVLVDESDAQPTPLTASQEPVLKWRREQVEREAQLQAQIAALRQQIAALSDSIAKAQQAAPQGPSASELALGQQLAQAQQQLAQLQAEKDKADKTAKGTDLDGKLDAFLHKLPVQGPIVKAEEKAVESEHPLQRFFGASTAIVLLTVIGTLVLVAIGMVLHGIYKLCHNHAPAIVSALSKVPVAGSALAGGFTALDNANTSVDAKVQAALANAKADLQAHVAALKTASAPPATATGTVSTTSPSPAAVLNAPATVAAAT